MAEYPLQKSRKISSALTWFSLQRSDYLWVRRFLRVVIKFSAILHNKITVQASVRLQPKKMLFFIKLIYDIFMPFLAFITNQNPR